LFGHLVTARAPHLESEVGELVRLGARALDPAKYNEWLERPPAGAFELLRQYPPELLLDEPLPKPPAPRKATRDEPDQEPAEAWQALRADMLGA
jgi:hypothetical protein